MKSYLPLKAGGLECKLRLTMAGQRTLREKWGEDILTFLLAAATDGARLCDLLTQALGWPGEENENPVTDGCALYDLLVDEGWRGQGAFAALAFELGEASGVLTPEQARTLKDTVERAFEAAFAGLEGP